MKWRNNEIYPNIFQSIANNESEYIELIKELCKPHKVLNQFVIDQWWEDEILIDEWETWHSLFETDEYYDEDVEFFTDPILYNKGLKNKPNQELYPIIVTYNIDRMIYWQSIKELQEK